MSERMTSSPIVRALLAVVLLAAVIAGSWWFLNDRDAWPRGEALGAALRPLIEGKNPDQSLVARVIWENYLETRSNASRWSGAYWGFTFTAAALVLKLETIIKNEGAKKDVAAALSVVAALLMTLSTSGDFQRKWQANRVAAAELEHAGYEFLEKDGADARSYLASVGQTLLARNMAIVGSTAPRKSVPESAKTLSPNK